MGHAEVKSTVELKIVPFVVLAKILASIVSARLVVVLLQAKLGKLSHGSVRTNESESLFVFTYVDIGAGVLIGAHVS